MKLKSWLCLLVIALFALPVLAQDTATHTVAFDGFSFSFPTSVATSVSVSQYAGDPPMLEQPGGPEVQHTQFVLYNNAPAPETFYEGAGGVRVYNAANFTGYDQSQQQVQLLQTLVAQRPDLAQYMTTDTNTSDYNLPFLPIQPAAQVIRAQAHYIDMGSFQGVAYVMAYRQDVSPLVGSEFRYAFEGVSSDGNTIVSANFPLNTTLFPADVPADFNMDDFNANFNTYMAQSVATLNSATAEDFTPSLTTLDSIIQSFAINAMGTGGAVTVPATVAPATTPSATATVINTDPTFGGLANATWVLTSYGSADAVQPTVEGATVTLTFAQSGISGNAGCNSYSGPFQYSNNSLSIGDIASTLIACEQPIQVQESAYLDALHTASTYQINGSQLQIMYDGGVLNFTAADALNSGAEATVEPTVAG